MCDCCRSAAQANAADAGAMGADGQAIDGQANGAVPLPGDDNAIGDDLFTLGATNQAAGNPLIPNMIGDFRAGSFSLDTMGTRYVDNPLLGGDRRFKISENFSPNPTNRIFFGFNHYQNALTGLDGSEGNLQRMSFGIERLVSDITSIEARLQFTDGLAPTQVLGARRMGVQFGNVSLISKTVLRETERSLISSGAAFTLPTSQNASTQLPSGETLTLVNDSYHVQPYLAYQYGGDLFFMQMFSAVDFAVTGDVVRRGDGSSERYFDQNLLSLDMTGGVWLTRNPGGFVTASAGVIELHYTTTINDTDAIFIDPTDGTALFSNQFNRMNILNMTAGVHFYFGDSNRLTIGAGAPLRTIGPDKLYDAEIMALFNHYY